MAKAANGEGSVHPRFDKAGKIVGYRGQYWIETPEGRKRRSVNGKTKTETRRLMRQAIAESQGIVEWDATTLTVAEYLREWLQEVEATRSPRTYANYRLHVEKHIIPELGSVKLARLTSSQVQSFYAREARGYKPSTVRYVHAVLHRALKLAVSRHRIIPRNPADDLELPSVSHKQTDTLTLAQAEMLLSTADASDGRLAALYYVALFGGLRIGEALALKWRDVDYEEGTLSVRHQVQNLRDGNGLTEIAPKRDERRVVQVGGRVMAALRAHRERQDKEKERAGDGYQDIGLVFSTTKGTHLEPSNVHRRSFKPLLQAAGLPDIRFHDQRHTFATLLTTRGVDLTTVQTMMGHSDPATTARFYGHSTPEAQKRAASLFDAPDGHPGAAS